MNLHDTSGPSSHTHNGCEQQEYRKKFLGRADTLAYINSNDGAFTTKELERMRAGSAYITPNGAYYPQESLTRVRRSVRPQDASENPPARVDT